MSVLAITKQINIMPQLLFGCMTLASRPGHDSETQLIMQYRSWCRERRSVAPAIHPSLCVWILLTLPSLPLPFPLSGLFLPFSSVFFFFLLSIWRVFWGVVYSHFFSLPPFFAAFLRTLILIYVIPTPKYKKAIFSQTKKNPFNFLFLYIPIFLG